MGQSVTTNTFDEPLDSTCTLHVVVLNNYKLNDNINIKVSKSSRYKVKHLLSSTIHHLQQTHQPTTYHIHYISFNSKQTTNSHHIQSHIYYSNETQKFDDILNSKLNDKALFKFEFLTECDVEIPITITCPFNARYTENTLKLSVWYNNAYFIRDLLTEIVYHLNSKHKHHANIGAENIQIVPHRSFCHNNAKNYPITHYKDVRHIHRIGLTVEIVNHVINCPYMTRENAMCPIYYDMVHFKKYTAENYKHLCIFNHPQYDTNACDTDRTHATSHPEEEHKCPDSAHCAAYARLANHGNAIEDKCHLKLYKHPITTHKRHSVWQQNITSFWNVSSQSHAGKHATEDLRYFPVYLPTFDDEERFNLHREEGEIGYLEPLKQEVINNGFRSDLYLKKDHDSIMEVVEEKLDLLRHKNISRRYQLNQAEMLAIVLYLNGECMEDMSEHQRNANYFKWKWLDRCLYDAIDKLSKCQVASYPFYCVTDPIHYIFNTLHARILKENESINISQTYQNGCFSTYVVGSKDKRVAIGAMRDLELLCEINKSFLSNQNKCCDISWVSNFPGQYDVIMQRNTSNRDQNGYKFKCFMAQNNVQTMSMYRD